MTTRAALSRDDVLAVVRGVIETVFELPGDGVTRETLLVEDLRADSIAMVEIADLVEERLARPGFHVVDADLDDIATVGELVDYVMRRL